MQWSRVKGTLILILLLVNSFLLITLGGKALSSYQRRREVREHLQVVLQKKKIMLSNEMTIPGAALIPQLSIDRNRAEEAALAAALLGENTKRKDDNEQVSFESDLGEVTWSEDGKINAQFTPQGYQMQENAKMQAYAERMLSHAGFPVSDAVWAVDQNKVTASLKTGGYDVFNRSLVTEFFSDRIEISGCWPFGEPYAEKSNFYAEYSPVDALVLFAQTSRAKEIYEIKPGLLMNSVDGNKFQLIPVWRLKTEAGIFFVDLLKNEVL